MNEVREREAQWGAEQPDSLKEGYVRFATSFLRLRQSGITRRYEQRTLISKQTVAPLPLRFLPVRWLVWTAILMLLPGCEFLRQTLPPLPRIDTPAKQSPPATASTAQSQITARMEEEVRQQINQIRRQRGLSQLQRHDRLAQVARNYSQRMAAENFFSHTSPSGDSMVERVQSAGIFYFVIGENLFKGTNLPQPVPVAVEGWMDSPGHRENILRSEYRETGIGIWRRGNTYYVTQLFLR